MTGRLLTLLALLTFGSTAQTTGVLPFSIEETRRIMAHGPWPTPRGGPDILGRFTDRP